jgi:hypothetical protein
MHLFNYFYGIVPNRFNQRLNADAKQFERVIFSALMKQLGFLMEVFNISLRIDNSAKMRELRGDDGVSEIAIISRFDLVFQPLATLSETSESLTSSAASSG